MENNNSPITNPLEPVTVTSPPLKRNFRQKVSDFFVNLRTKGKIIGGSLGTLALIGFLAAGVLLTQQRQSTKTEAGTTKVNLTLAAANLYPKAGEIFSVDVGMVPAGMNVSGANLEVKYDPAKLEAQSIVPQGGLLPMILIPESKHPTFGRIDITLGCLVNETGAYPKSQTGTLARVTFKALANGKSDISFGYGTTVAATEQAGSVVGTVGPTNALSIDVGGVPPTTTPSPSATPTVPGSTTINDSATSIAYNGTWSYFQNRNMGDYQNDVHGARDNGSYFQYTFTGTGVEYVTEKNSDEGDVDIYIDGVLQQTVSCANPTRLAQQVVFSKTGMPKASHTIKIVKKSGNWMLLDTLKIYGS